MMAEKGEAVLLTVEDERGELDVIVWCVRMIRAVCASPPFPSPLGSLILVVENPYIGTQKP